MTMNAPLRSCLKSSSSSSRSRSSSQKRKVTFKAKKVVRKIPLLSAYSKEDIEATWYDSREVSGMMELINQLVIEAEESPEGATIRDLNGECLRGLERKTTEGHTEAFLARVEVYNAVLDEQEKQWKQSKDHFDHDKVAALCREASEESKQVALNRAKQDEAAVQAYLYKEGPFLHKKEPELDLKSVFSKAQPATKRSSSPSSDSWTTASTEASSNSYETEGDSDTEQSVSSTNSNTNTACSGNTITTNRSSFTTAKKISTPAVPRPNAPKRKLPQRAKNLSFQQSNEVAIRRQLQIPTEKRRPTTNLKPVKVVASKIAAEPAPAPAAVVVAKKDVTTPAATATATATVAPTKKKVVRRKSKGLSLECSAFIAQG